MPDDFQALREVVSRVAHQIGQAATHNTLDAELTSVGLPSSTSGNTKAELTASSLDALPDSHLVDVARRMLAGYEWPGSDRRILQDLLWAREGHPPVSKRTRREIARALPTDDLNNHYQRFRTLLDSLFELDARDFFDFGPTIGGQIDRHFNQNPDWSVEEVFDAVGAIDSCSDRRFMLLVEGIVSGDTVPDEEAQRRLVARIDPPLASAGLHLRELAATEGYPTFTVVPARSRVGQARNLIFASPRKPDLRLSDAIDNEIELCSDPEDVLVYDRPISADGVRWRDLQAWYRDIHQLDTDHAAKTALYRRLRQSLPAESPPQLMLFDLYHEIHANAVNDLPALLPEVWLHWDPQTIRARGARALLNLRMDFLLLVSGGARIVLEVDGRTHYAKEQKNGPDENQWVADPPCYARTMAGSRELTLAGYEVYRFGAHELLSAPRARPILTTFFADLFRRHHVPRT